MKGVFRIFALCLSLCGLSNLALAMEVAAKANGTALVSKPAANGEKLGTLTKGEKVQVENRVGMYWAAQWNGKKVFVKVSETESAAIGGAAKVSYKEDANKAGRQRATAVMGIRGLDDKEDVTAGSGKGSPELMRQMEQRQIDPKGVAEIEKAVNAELEAKAAAPAN